MTHTTNRPKARNSLVAELEPYEIAWMKLLSEKAKEESPKFAGFVLRAYLEKEDMPAEIKALRDAEENAEA